MMRRFKTANQDGLVNHMPNSRATASLLVFQVLPSQQPSNTNSEKKNHIYIQISMTRNLNQDASRNQSGITLPTFSTCFTLNVPIILTKLKKPSNQIKLTNVSLVRLKKGSYPRFLFYFLIIF